MRFVMPFIAIMGLACVAIAQVAEPVIVPISNEDFISLLFQSLGGMAGASSLAIAGLIVQLLIKFMSAPMFGEVFKELPNGKKLLFVSFLSLAAGTISLMAGPAALSLGAALIHSSNLAALMVFGNQVYKAVVAESAPVA